MKIQEVVEKSSHAFRNKQYPTARLDAELLISQALSLSRIDLYLKFDQPLSEPEIQRCREHVGRRLRGEPVAYILEKKEFFGINFHVDRRVLIPRPESETLVERALEFLTQATKTTPDQVLEIADFGCGSGCLGLAVLKQFPQCRAALIDRSADALAVAKANAIAILGDGLQVAASRPTPPRCEFWEGRVQDFGNDKLFDLVIANPPYIAVDDSDVQKSVKEFEPHTALFAEEDGFLEIRQWSQKAFQVLRPGGQALFEIGSKQGGRAAENFGRIGFSDVKVGKDLAGHDRIVIATR